MTPLLAAAAVQQPSGDGAPVGEQVVEHPGALRGFPPSPRAGWISTSMWREPMKSLTCRACGTLVHRRAAEPHADGLQGALARRERGDQAGVQAAREQQAERDVGDQVLLDHLVQAGRHSSSTLSPSPRGSAASGPAARTMPRPRRCGRRALPGDAPAPVCARHAAWCAARRRRSRTPGTAAGRLGPPARRKPGSARKALSSDANTMPCRPGQVVQRLHAHGVARQVQGARPRVPERQREHAGQPREAVRCPIAR